MTGVKVSAGDPIIHLALLVGVFMLPRQASCPTGTVPGPGGIEVNIGESSFDEALNLLLVSHFVNALRIPITMVGTQLRIIYFRNQFNI